MNNKKLFKIDQNIAIEKMFIFAALLSFFASLIFFSLKVTKNKASRTLPILPVIRAILTSTAIIPLIMVFLGACIYISMMNFQFIIAKDNNLNFSIFLILFHYYLQDFI